MPRLSRTRIRNKTRRRRRLAARRRSRLQRRARVPAERGRLHGTDGGIAVVPRRRGPFVRITRSALPLEPGGDRKIDLPGGDDDTSDPHETRSPIESAPYALRAAVS